MINLYVFYEFLLNTMWLTYPLYRYQKLAFNVFIVIMTHESIVIFSKSIKLSINQSICALKGPKPEP